MAENRTAISIAPWRDNAMDGYQWARKKPNLVTYLRWADKCRLQDLHCQHGVEAVSVVE